TDAFGNFTIEGLPPGTYTLRVSTEGFTPYTDQVIVVVGDITRVSISLTPTSNVGAIVGTVIDLETQQPIQGALVEILNAQEDVVATKRTDAFGNFTIEGLPPGTYTLRVSAEGFATYTPQQVTVLENEIKSIDITLIPKLTTIVGVACDIKTRLRLPNILIEVFNTDDKLITSILTDSDGQYKICELSAGTFNVKASSKSHLSESRVVALVPGETGVADFALVRKQVLPPETSTDPRQNNIMSEVLLQTLTLNSQVTFKSTKTWIKNSHNIKIQLSDNQSANSLQLSLHLAIALILNIISDTTDSDDLVIQESIQQSIIKADKQSIVIENSRDITIITNDTDLTANIQILLQILVAILIQIDIV
ncbi:carboxypeptidase regulatory-like domain-containing protein, partial [Priestia megaterium]|uniref:carboxypeptidase regulatory-like domain-containing protein n=1 Tax=Priestia megaterium TaxID=1404 RepID=UPI002E1EB6E3|nr:carboxypeptidase regulatory-like domain-containing protein [Priestia megaterium]